MEQGITVVGVEGSMVVVTTTTPATITTTVTTSLHPVPSIGDADTTTITLSKHAAMQTLLTM